MFLLILNRGELLLCCRLSAEFIKGESRVCGFPLL